MIISIIIIFFAHIILGMRKEKNLEYMKNLDERETFVNNFTKREEKNETKRI